MVPKQKRAYKSIREELLAELDSGVLMASNPLTRMIRLSQLASAYGEVDEEGNLTLTEPSCKLDAFDELLEELGDEQVVAFSESRQLVELAAKRLEKQHITHGLITGKITPIDRERNVTEFQDHKLQVILATLGAGGEGITLTAARHVVFLQRSFSLIKNKQAEDRVWRRGQDRDVQPIYITTRDSIEQHVLEVGEDKEGRLEEVVRDQETLRRWLSK